MQNEIIVNAGPGETRVAILERSSFSEFHLERERVRSVVGNVVKGRVSRVLPGMQAAFVDIGLEKAAFLYVGQRMARGVEAQMANPVVSRLAAEALLHADALPAGYKASLSLSVPLLGRVAVLEQRSGSGELFLYLESSGAPWPASRVRRASQS